MGSAALASPDPLSLCEVTPGILHGVVSPLYKITPVILHGVVSPLCKGTPVILYGVVSPDCRVNMAHIGQPGPFPGLYLQVNVLKGVPSSFGSGPCGVLTQILLAMPTFSSSSLLSLLVIEGL